MALVPSGLGHAACNSALEVLSSNKSDFIIQMEEHQDYQTRERLVAIPEGRDESDNVSRFLDAFGPSGARVDHIKDLRGVLIYIMRTIQALERSYSSKCSCQYHNNPLNPQ